MDDIPEIPAYAAELEAELAFGEIKYTPDEGIRKMGARIAGLTEELRVAHDGPPDPKRAAIIQKQMADARRRLENYKFQLERRN